MGNDQRSTISFLLIDDGELNSRVLGQVLKKGLPRLLHEKYPEIPQALIPNIEFSWATNKASAIQTLKEKPVDCIILDYHIGNEFGDKIAEELRAIPKSVINHDHESKQADFFQSNLNAKILTWSTTYNKTEYYGDGRIHAKPLFTSSLKDEKDLITFVESKIFKLIAKSSHDSILHHPPSSADNHDEKILKPRNIDAPRTPMEAPESPSIKLRFFAQSASNDKNSSPLPNPAVSGKRSNKTGLKASLENLKLTTLDENSQKLEGDKKRKLT